MSKRTRIGSLVTAGYLLAIAEGASFYATIDGMTLNTWGDFLAGVIAPSAQNRKRHSTEGGR